MSTAPHWLELQAEIDYRLFLLEGLRQRVAKRSPIDLMIDLATGHQAELEKEAEELMAEITALKAEYYAEVGGQQ